jgi:hypothetical protein
MARFGCKCLASRIRRASLTIFEVLQPSALVNAARRSREGSLSLIWITFPMRQLVLQAAVLLKPSRERLKARQVLPPLLRGSLVNV